jgi:hypothetical protein
VDRSAKEAAVEDGPEVYGKICDNSTGRMRGRLGGWVDGETDRQRHRSQKMYVNVINCTL